MVGRLRRIRWILLCVGLLGLSAACASDNPTDAGQPNAEHGSTGDTAPGELVQVGGDDPEPEGDEPAPTEQALPDGPEENSSEQTKVRLKALEQPGSEYPKPKLPDKPAEDSDELTHIVYLLESSSWKAAGMVDKDTDTDCSIDSSELTQEGSYDFGCTVSIAGAKVKYEVTAEVKDKKVPITLDTEKLPVSEDKAVHEATRQAFKPARVTCDIVGVEAIRVGKKDGFTCWVTDVENNRTTYLGEVMEDGQLALRQQ